MRFVNFLLALTLLVAVTNTGSAHDSLKMRDLVGDRLMEDIRKYAACYGILKQCNADNEGIRVNKNMIITKDGRIILPTVFGELSEGQLLQPGSPADRREFLARLEDLRNCYASYVDCLDDLR